MAQQEQPLTSQETSEELKKLGGELEEMEKAEGEFGEVDETEGTLSDELAEDVAGGVRDPNAIKRKTWNGIAITTKSPKQNTPLPVPDQVRD